MDTPSLPGSQEAFLSCLPECDLCQGILPVSTPESPGFVAVVVGTIPNVKERLFCLDCSGRLFGTKLDPTRTYITGSLAELAARSNTG